MRNVPCPGTSTESCYDARMWDLAVVGAGAAGLMTAITAAETVPALKIVCLDGAAKLGAKILISGGGRCNVTHDAVAPEDFNATSRPILRRILSAFPVAETRDFFESMGVHLKVESDGKLFPMTDRARTVLDTLIARTNASGCAIKTLHRVTDITSQADSFTLTTSTGPIYARRVVLATGGQSIPKTGSDGEGYQLARKLGHTIMPTRPGLVPLVLEGSKHASLSGISLPVTLTLKVNRRTKTQVHGPMLWTHFGISGPGPMNLSRHWEYASEDQVELRANFLPNETFESVDGLLLKESSSHGTRRIKSVLEKWIPERMAAQQIADLNLPENATLAHLTRESRHNLIRSLVAAPLRVVRSRGYNYAEVTAGGVPLTEINPSTLESRQTQGLYLVGEILDVDGRIGGYNFQWAWSSGHVAGIAAARALEAIRAA